jgi:4-amino-4-deoxy-L-arabinose transferase-like glycosyltransferase
MSTPGHGRRGWILLLLVVIAALLVRLVFVLTLSDEPLWHDAREYDALARELNASGEYRTGEGAPTAFWPPGYPGFLAGIYRWIDPGVTAARIVQALLGALTCWLLYRVAERLADRRVAILSALGLAIYPLLIYTTGTLYPVTLVAFLWVAVICLLFGARAEHRLRFLGAGLLAGAIALTTPSALVAILAAAIWIGWHLTRSAPRGGRRTGWRPWRAVLLFLLPVVLLTGGWAVRNARVLGDPAIGSTNGGFNLWLGNHPDATATRGNRLTPEMQTEMGQIFADHRGDEVARDRAFFARARDYIRDEPLRFLALSATKAVNLWRLYPQPMSTAEEDAAGRRWLSLLSYGLLLPFAILGAAWQARRDRRAWLFLLLALAYTVVHAVFISKVRFRLPLDPFVILLGVIGIVMLWDRVWRRSAPAQSR